jgi:hypothetical protein
MAFLARAGGSIHPREWLLKSAAVAPIERGFQLYQVTVSSMAKD